MQGKSILLKQVKIYKLFILLYQTQFRIIIVENHHNIKMKNNLDNRSKNNLKQDIILIYKSIQMHFKKVNSKICGKQIEW